MYDDGRYWFEGGEEQRAERGYETVREVEGVALDSVQCGVGLVLLSDAGGVVACCRTVIKYPL